MTEDFRSRITPVVITFNEEPNVARVFDQLRWADRVLVVDSGSTDQTLRLIGEYPNVRVLHHPFASFSGQWNFALPHVETDWVLTLDADYVLTGELVEELGQLVPTSDVCGYSATFTYWSLGRPLRGTLYPPRTVLFRREGASFHEEGHQQKLAVAGAVRPLQGRILHDDRKDLSRWLAAQSRYASLECERLLSSPSGSLDWPDRIRRTGVLAPVLATLYALLAKGCILDGIPGLYYAGQRGVAEAVLALRLLEARRARLTRA